MIFDKKYPNMSNVHLESGTYTYIFRKIGIECGAKRLFLVHTRTKSLYRSRAGRHFYETENVIWAGFGPIGNTEKKDFGRL